MAQIFRRSADTWLRFGAAALALLIVAGLVVNAGYGRSPFVTEYGLVKEQPIPFSHEHHVRSLGIDCRYCHFTVEKAANAGFPPTHVCMTCHSQEWTNAQMLAPVRESLRTGKPLHWNRVSQLPDYVYFNHSIHIDRGVACRECHGRVDTMPLMKRAKPFTMKFCTDCHRDPAMRLGPRDQVTAMTPPLWSEEEHKAFARRAMARFHIDPKRLDKCDICHR